MWENIIPNTDCGLRSLTSLFKLRHRITPVIEYSITQMKRKITVSYFPFHLTNLNIKRLRVTIRFGPHIAAGPKMCESHARNAAVRGSPRWGPAPRGLRMVRVPALMSRGAPASAGPGRGPCSPWPALSFRVPERVENPILRSPDRCPFCIAEPTVAYWSKRNEARLMDKKLLFNEAGCTWRCSDTPLLHALLKQASQTFSAGNAVAADKDLQPIINVSNYTFTRKICSFLQPDKMYDNMQPQTA